MADFRRPFRSPPLRKRTASVLQFEPHIHRRKKDRRKSWWKANWAFVLLFAAPVVGIGVAWLGRTELVPILPLTGPAGAISEQYQVSFVRCDGPVRTTCVVDGDTFWLDGTKYRISDINTPEIGSPECGAEAALGEQATIRLVSLLNSGGFSLRRIDRDEDSFGRKLRIVTRSGQSIGNTLVTEGLAEPWTGSRRSWC